MRLMSTAVAGAAARLVLSVCMFMQHRPQSEAGSKAEPDGLKSVIGFVDEWESVVHTDRAERRNPLQANAGGDPHQIVVEHAGAAIGGDRISAPQRPGIDENLAQQWD